MIALSIWSLAVGVADLLAGPRGGWDGDSLGQPARGTLSLLVVAGSTTAASGLPAAEAASLIVAVALSGGAWLWLRHRGAELVALLVLTAALFVFVATASLWSAPGGPLLEVLSWSAFAEAAGGPDVLLLVMALATLLLATGNGIVRIALGQVERDALEQEDHLKGGRIIGPLERVLVFGLGVAGQLTAAGLVVAAKGLLRYSDLRGQRQEGASSRRVELMSEYLLVGSLLSWTVAFAAVAIVVAAAN